MSLHIASSAYYFKLGSRVIDKITEEYNPPSYWFRLKVTAKGKPHNQCTANITNLWWGSSRRVNGFDPLVGFWINEPKPSGDHTENVMQQFYKPNIISGHYEILGLIHVKLPMKPVDPNLPVPEGNIPDEQLPEVKVNESENAPKHTSKRQAFPYGIYYIEVGVSDDQGDKAKKIFKVWAFRDQTKCKIRSSRFYERFMLRIKSLLPPV